jgi:predicted HTH domain antitoxin
VSLEKKLEKWRRLEEEAREIRRREADWKFIESQPPRVRAALIYYIESGDIRTSAKLAGMDLEDFRELLRKANIPVVT